MVYRPRAPGAELDATLLFLSLIPSGIGFVLFTYGRKQSEWLLVIGGLLLMVYPYFTTSVTSLVGVGLGIGALIYFGVSAGW
jgi:hypothetical protein